MVELPTIEVRLFRLRAWHIDVGQGVLGAVPTLLVGLSLFDGKAPRPVSGFLLVLVAALLAVLATVKAKKNRERELRLEPSQEPLLIVDWARRLYRRLRQHYGDDEARWKIADVRVTVHKVDRSRACNAPSTFQQLANYVGGRQAGLGRRFPARAGIIGLCERYGEAIVAERQAPDPHQFAEEMVLRWGYTWDEANGLATDRVAWMAVPITDGENGPVVGVIYIDSAESQFFDEEIQNLVVVECTELAELVQREYRTSP